MESPRVRAGALIALAVFCALGAVVTYLVFVRTHVGAHADEAVIAGRGAATVRGTEFAQNLLRTISGSTLLLATLVLVIQAVVRGRRTLALVAAVAIVGPVISSELLKHIVLERPALQPSPLMQNSFPSGHTTIAYGLAVAATIVAPPALRNRVAFVGTAYGGAIGVATVAAGWHRPSDVLGAYLVTIAWASAVLAVALMLDRRDFQRGEFTPPTETAWARYLAIGAALLVVAYAVAMGVVLAGALGITDWTRVHGAFIAACASLVAAAAVLMAAFLAALNRATATPKPERLSGRRDPVRVEH
jgi:membrane-associated phospholipid phosphatase